MSLTEKLNLPLILINANKNHNKLNLTFFLNQI